MAVEPGRPLAMFPLSTVLFPGAGLPLHVFERRYRALVDDCLAGSGELGVVLITRGAEVGGGDQRAAVGTAAAIEAARRLPDGRWLLLVRGERRIRVRTWLGEDPYPHATVVDEPDSDGAPETLLADARRVVSRARALASELGARPPHDDPKSDASAAGGVWTLCGRAPLGALDRQRLLEVPGAAERLSLLVTLVDAVCDDLMRILAGG
jgi:Lon protease-like protein